VHRQVVSAGHPAGDGRLNTRRAFTLLELLVVSAIILILSGIAVVHFQAAQVRAKISASKANLRTLSDALSAYHVDWNSYPAPTALTATDPYGVFAAGVLGALTTPVPYVGSAAFHDPFGQLLMQTAQVTVASSALDPPVPVNEQRSLFYFNYPYFSWLTGDAALKCNGFCAASVGPDTRDSLIVYYPFPASLTSSAGYYGIRSIQDTVYDPTNGTTSGGDLAAFGGELHAPALLGGGQP
jgi:prepilin-type N-terminal cleavage/methylation domain-containing protein